MSSCQPEQLVLMYFLLPLWIAAGLADALCHRRADIAHTAGPFESLLHLLMLVEVGLPLLAALFLEIDALLIALMLVAFSVHEATALWDVGYASRRRRVSPIEQHVHSFLEMIPLMSIIVVVILRWEQFLAIFGAGPQPARWELRWKEEPLPAAYVVVLLACVAVFSVGPYLLELAQGLKASRQAATAAGASGSTGIEPR